MIITDFGSGNTCQNNISYIYKMIDELAKVDKKRQCIIKWQLFQKAEPNIPLTHESFFMAYRYAKKLGFKTTASVFDLPSLRYLLEFDIPFVKIANRSDLYWLAGEIPRKISVIVSTNNRKQANIFKWTPTLEYMCCVSKYPAEEKDYNKFNKLNLSDGISDHTTNWDICKRYKPRIYECHFKLEDSTGLDAGVFARTPEQLKEIL